MEITKETNIGQLVAGDYRAAAVLQQQGVDFCCSGNRTIAEACDEKQIDADMLLQTLQNATAESAQNNIDYSAWPLDLLADYIEKTHHRYVRTKGVEITPYLEKITKVHGARHPELAQINQLFAEATGSMGDHMAQEENVLFPFIRSLVAAREDGKVAGTAQFDSVENPIKSMTHDHSKVGDRLKKITELSNNFTPPSDGCNTYRVTYALLKEFTDDMYKHIHLENNILFPKAVALEKAA